MLWAEEFKFENEKSRGDGDEGTVSLVRTAHWWCQWGFELNANANENSNMLVFNR